MTHRTILLLGAAVIGAYALTRPKPAPPAPINLGSGPSSAVGNVLVNPEAASITIQQGWGGNVVADPWSDSGFNRHIAEGQV